MAMRRTAVFIWLDMYMLDLSWVRRVGVGTTNPVKVAAVKDVFVKLWMFEVDVSWFNSQSHVSEMLYAFLMEYDHWFYMIY